MSDHESVASGFQARLDERENRKRQRDASEPLRPLSTSYSLQMHPTGPNKPQGRIPNTPSAVSLISFLHGGIFFLSISTFCSKLLASGRLYEGCVVEKGFWWATPQLGFFLAAWSIFHSAEFAVTARWNREKCSVDSFLLDNGALYHIAHGTALTEYLLSLYFWPSLKAYSIVSYIGIVLTFLGQSVRSAAMIHAAGNFSHQILFRKAEQHRLVTDGIYAYFRHPSYAGFFYWALGTQLVLQNPISFVLYSILLWRFFSKRIRMEETSLVQFFGDDYVQYKKRVGTRIPFVP